VTPKVLNTATPVDGSATALTSATVRRAQPVSCCQLGLAYTLWSSRYQRPSWP
jgi:hypothetical protein